jgi:hypothetical protein
MILRMEIDSIGSKDLEKVAFSYCNDALCSTLPVRYSPEMIAFAAIYAGCEALGENLATLHGTKWWAVKQLNQDHLKGV